MATGKPVVGNERDVKVIRYFEQKKLANKTVILGVFGLNLNIYEKCVLIILLRVKIIHSTNVRSKNNLFLISKLSLKLIICIEGRIYLWNEAILLLYLFIY